MKERKIKKLILMIFKRSELMYLFFCFIFFYSIRLYSQVKDSSSLHNEYINVVKEFEPKIDNLLKISRNPEIIDTSSTPKKVNIIMLNRNMTTNYEPEEIKAAKVSGESMEKLYNYMIKLGFGNYVTPIGEIYYSSNRSKKNMFSGYYRHLSSSGKMQGYKYPEYSDNELSLLYKHFTKNNNCVLLSNFNRNAFCYYGINDTILRDFGDSIKKKDIYNRFVKLNSEVSIDNGIGKKWMYKGGIKHVYFEDYGDNVENDININGLLNREFKKSDKYDVLKFVVDFDGNFYINKYVYDDSSKNENSNLLGINSYIDITKNILTIRGGFKSYFENNNYADVFRVVPDVNFLLKLSDKVIPYGGVGGYLKSNTYRVILEENRYANLTDNLRNSYCAVSFYGGLKGVFINNINYNIKVNYDKLNNIVFYITDTNNIFLNTFLPVYSDGDVLSLYGDIGYIMKDKIKMNLGIKYDSYSNLSEAKAWYKPNLRVDYNISYNLYDKIYTSGSVYYVGERYGRIGISGGDYVIKKFKSVVDCNIMLEYRYSKLFSVFLKMNNLGFQKYYLWNNYASQQFNFIAGFTYIM